MSRHYPALDVIWPVRPDDERIDVLIAEIDDDAPTAIEERESGLRIFFSTAISRGRAAVRLVALEPDLICEPIDVPDEAWAERSQATLEPVRVGRIVVVPAKDLGGHFAGAGAEMTSEVIVICPSMGFGTGHHASTRLCLRLLQDLPLANRDVLDVGTGSGVLAIAAARLGAARVVAIDNDDDALTSARENVELNGVAGQVTLLSSEVGAGFGRPDAEPFDVVLANVTGGMLIRHASVLASLVRPDGTLVTSGYESNEERQVTQALTAAGLTAAYRAEEDGWIAQSFRAVTFGT